MIFQTFICRAVRIAKTRLLYPVCERILRALSGRRPIDTVPNKILLAFFGRGLGDSIYFSGVLKPIREKFPKAQVHLAVLNSMLPYFQKNPFVDQIHPCPDYHQKGFKTYLGFLHSAWRLRKVGTFDLFLELCPNLFLSPIAWGCMIRKHLSAGIGDPFKRLFYDISMPILWDRPFYENFPAILDAAGVYIEKPEFWTPPEEDIASLLPSGQSNTKAVLVAPGGKRNIEAPKEYCWVFEGFNHVIHALIQRGHAVILVGASYDAGNLPPLPSSPLLINLVGKTSLGQLFALLKKNVTLVICNNSGLLHAASVLGIPSVSYADPQENLLRWNPYPMDSRHAVLQDTDTCKVTAEEMLSEVLKKV